MAKPTNPNLSWQEVMPGMVEQGGLDTAAEREATKILSGLEEKLTPGEPVLYIGGSEPGDETFAGTAGEDALRPRKIRGYKSRYQVDLHLEDAPVAATPGLYETDDSRLSIPRFFGGEGHVDFRIFHDYKAPVDPMTSLRREAKAVVAGIDGIVARVGKQPQAGQLRSLIVLKAAGIDHDFEPDTNARRFNLNSVGLQVSRLALEGLVNDEARFAKKDPIYKIENLVAAGAALGVDREELEAVAIEYIKQRGSKGEDSMQFASALACMEWALDRIYPTDSA
ncbi:MAG TPA: hypothetical protein VFW77_00435 [Candidatus Saccharimonadales bacterium]|nr:hypothetical protein [Candidatus Saccharimonadales bacterium]